MTKALELGKQLKERCAAIDKPHISEQLDQLNNAWSQLNSDSLARKHSLEDGLLQLGQFQDALGELLAWVIDSTAKLSTAPPPGIKVGTVETQVRDLQVSVQCACVGMFVCNRLGCTYVCMKSFY